jgi:hypothetical protein
VRRLAETSKKPRGMRGFFSFGPLEAADDAQPGIAKAGPDLHSPARIDSVFRRG